MTENENSTNFVENQELKSEVCNYETENLINFFSRF